MNLRYEGMSVHGVEAVELGQRAPSVLTGGRKEKARLSGCFFKRNSFPFSPPYRHRWSSCSEYTYLLFSFVRIGRFQEDLFAAATSSPRLLSTRPPTPPTLSSADETRLHSKQLENAAAETPFPGPVFLLSASHTLAPSTPPTYSPLHSSP
ncbi:hypothetical protein BKA81DRAFT_40895 [Phyllosticta paracitricarpa]